MIKRWKIGNFKAIKDPIELPLTPLTVFCGPNSSGKSSFIKSILTVAQSLGSSAWEEPLVLNGRFVQLGYIEEILHHGLHETPLDIGFTVRIKSDRDKESSPPVYDHIALDSSLEAVPLEVPRGVRTLYTSLEFSELTVTYADYSEERMSICKRLDDPVWSRHEVEHASKVLQTQITRDIFAYDIREPKGTELSPEPIIAEAIAASFHNMLPGRLLFRVRPDVREVTQEIRQLAEAILALSSGRHMSSAAIDWERTVSNGAKAAFGKLEERIPRGQKSSDDYVETLRAIVQDIAAMHGHVTVRQLVNYIDDQVSRSTPKHAKHLIGDMARRLSSTLIEIQEVLFKRSTHNGTELEVQPFPVRYNRILDRVRQALGYRVYYLGPLRDDPRVIYATPSLPNQRDVGLKGEYTAAMLETYANDYVTCPRPPAPSDPFTGSFAIDTETTLIEATQLWLQRMGLAESLEATESAKIGYQLSLTTTDLARKLDLTGVGVGVSQVLPTIVMALLAPEESILIFEQPEVHLHPKVQSVLGDFFLGIIACGKQCLIETHSEYLINRLRRRIAESQDTAILDHASIYFVNREKGASQYTRITPNEFGAILDWPAGFFDEVEEESSLIMNAALTKRKQRKQQSRLPNKE